MIKCDNTPIYFQTNGSTALANEGTELIGHGIEKHPNGYGSTLGKLEGINTAIEDMSPRDLDVYGIIEGKTTCLNFEGGIKVEGEIITGKRDLQGKIILISFNNCLVTHNETVLFDPSWGVYDMAIGNHITSAFAGPCAVRKAPRGRQSAQAQRTPKAPKGHHNPPRRAAAHAANAQVPPIGPARMARRDRGQEKTHRRPSKGFLGPFPQGRPKRRVSPVVHVREKLAQSAQNGPIQLAPDRRPSRRRGAARVDAKRAHGHGERSGPADKMPLS